MRCLGHRATVLIDLVPGTVPLLRDMAAEAVGEGARKVRVRPYGVDRVDLVYAAVELNRVAEDDAIEVQFDVTSAALLRADPAAFVRVDPLVVKADGTVVPICAGLERYALGALGPSMDDCVLVGPRARPGPVPGRADPCAGRHRAAGLLVRAPHPDSSWDADLVLITRSGVTPHSSARAQP